MLTAASENKEWLTAIPLVYSDDPAFWTREAGLMCLGFRKAGVKSRFVALGPPSVRDDAPVITATLQDFHESRWWSQWNAQGVFLTSWGALRFKGIARAIKESGALLAIRLDASGTPSPRINFRRFLQTMYGSAVDTGR